jgi:hypothetical protein
MLAGVLVSTTTVTVAVALVLAHSNNAVEVTSKTLPSLGSCCFGISTASCAYCL